MDIDENYILCIGIDFEYADEINDQFKENISIKGLCSSRAGRDIRFLYEDFAKYDENK